MEGGTQTIRPSEGSINFLLLTVRSYRVLLRLGGTKGREYQEHFG
jgi:hypothetical protein